MPTIHLGIPDDCRAFIASGATHQVVSLRLAAALLQHVEHKNLGRVIQSPFRVILSKGTVVQPDILFIRKTRIGLMAENGLQGPPDLIIEVMAPDTRERDQIHKRNLYSRFEVQEYWIVDPDAQTIEILLWSELGYARHGVYGKSDRLTSPALPGFRFPAHRFFPKCNFKTLPGQAVNSIPSAKF